MMEITLCGWAVQKAAAEAVRAMMQHKDSSRGKRVAVQNILWVVLGRGPHITIDPDDLPILLLIVAVVVGVLLLALLGGVLVKGPTSRPSRPSRLDLIRASISDEVIKQAMRKAEVLIGPKGFSFPSKAWESRRSCTQKGHCKVGVIFEDVNNLNVNKWDVWVVDAEAIEVDLRPHVPS